MLRCRDSSYYTGHTESLERRVAEYQAGESATYTAARLPVALVFAQVFASRDEALACERQIKGWSRKKKEAMLRGDWAEVSRLAKARNSGQSSDRHPSTSSG
jgi:predicted GIY-YIG superfamily endonuclease